MRGKRMVPMEGEEPLEGLEGAGGTITPTKRSEGQAGRKAPVTEAKRPQWRRYRSPNPEKCDECVSLMVAGGPLRAPNRATSIRTWKGKEEYLCFPHAQDRRVLDGLEPYKR